MLVSYNCFEFAEKYAGIENEFKIHKVAILVADEAVREDMWLEDIYGKQSRLDNDVWLEAVSGKSSWIFKPDELRQKVFISAKLKWEV